MNKDQATKLARALRAYEDVQAELFEVEERLGQLADEMRRLLPNGGDYGRQEVVELAAAALGRYHARECSWGPL